MSSTKREQRGTLVPVEEAVMETGHLPVPPPPPSDEPVHRIRLTRRSFIGQAGLVTVGLCAVVPAAMSFRSVIPNVLYEPPRRVKVGALDRFTDGGTFLPDQRLFIFREKDTLHCVSAQCTHLGCTVALANMPNAEGGFEFHCPCHGSKFRADGTNFAGPAPKPLDYFMLEISPDDGQLIVDKSKPADKGWRLTVRA